jgi:hypothetical protein
MVLDSLPVPSPLRVYGIQENGNYRLYRNAGNTLPINVEKYSRGVKNST